MKLNAVQKLLLSIYLLLFIFISMVRVPFRSGRSIHYDTIFSSNGDVDFGRWGLFMVVATVACAVGMLLARSAGAVKMKKVFAGLTIVAVLVIATVVGWFYYNAHLKKKQRQQEEAASVTTDSATVITPSTVTENSSYLEALEKKKREACNVEKALSAFNAHMKFNYPDYKIYGKPVIKTYGDCVYRVQFTSIDPHIRYQKEVFIVEIQIASDYESFYFREIRGTLY